MTFKTDQIYQWFVEQGFHLTYRSTAIRLLAHKELPGVEVRIGTGYVVVDRDGHEEYRVLVREFDPAAVPERVLTAAL